MGGDQLSYQTGTSRVGEYSFTMHIHRFSAWAASRAASVKGCRFSVEEGRSILEHCGWTSTVVLPDALPEASSIDAEHRIWRRRTCDFAAGMNLPFTHGVAAKLINVYLKARFVCGGHHEHPNVISLHPPIDKVLLEDLASKNFGSSAKIWKRASQRGWSKLSSDEYEDLIVLIRASLGGQPMWAIEEFWKGNQ